MNARADDSDLEKAVAGVRATRADIAIRPDRWDTPFGLASVDMLLRDPFKMGSVSEEQAAALSGMVNSADLLRQAVDWLGLPVSEAPLLPATHDPVQDLFRAISQAQPLLDRAVHSLTPENRKKALDAWEDMLRNNEGTADLEFAVQASTSFDQASLIQAAYNVARAVDRALPLLERSPHPVDNPELLIRYGKSHTYQRPVAAAGEKQIRVVIDFAEEVTIDTASAPSAGSGIFGIGLLYLPNARGTKILRGGDFSQGAGLFGVGGVFVQGSSATFTCGNAGQGAGLFGIGLFSADIPANAAYQIDFGGQGAGFTRGAGIFIHHGSQADIRGGLTYPDPREELGFTSFCQGVGYGPRAYAAGGVGLALVQGDHNHIESSYFAQGSGYWLGFGGFFVLGDENAIQARRYDQGAGIHTAAGAMLLRGNKNTLMNWAVGPAYGWDYGVGYFALEGNENTAQASWGSGHGDINGHALADISGDKNTLALPAFGSGAISRNAPSYGVVSVSGESNQIIPVSSPWGIQQISSSTILKDTFDLTKPEWPTVPKRAESKEKEKTELSGKMARAEKEPASDRIGDWLFVAAYFGLDQEVPAQARDRLWTLTTPELPAFIERVTPERFDEYLYARSILAAYAALSTNALHDQFISAQGTRKMMLLSLMSYGAPKDFVSVVQASLNDPDWRIRRAALGVLGYWFDQEEGRTPGRLTIIRMHDKTIRAQTSEKYIADLFALLALKPDLPITDRLTVAHAQKDLPEALATATWQVYADVLLKNKKFYDQAFRAELEAAKQFQRQLLPLVTDRLHDPDPEVVQAALITLGQWDTDGAADTIRPFLGDDKAYIREGAATALSKMGRAGKRALEKALKDPEERVRLIAAVGLKQF